jgi:uncharacterized protein involved in exopolysaccharide biosynthesis
MAPSPSSLSAYDAFYGVYQAQVAHQAAVDTLQQRLDAARADLKQAKAASSAAWQQMMATMAADHPGLEPAAAELPDPPAQPAEAPPAAPAEAAAGATPAAAADGAAAAAS